MLRGLWALFQHLLVRIGVPRVRGYQQPAPLPVPDGRLCDSYLVCY